jgi:DNA polymerase I-like protein with 3'-5' exonuclease and polymerase domains
MTARVAHRGVRIDEARLRELAAEHTRLQAEASARVRAFGVENPGSGPQVAEALQKLGEMLPVSEKGNASVAEHVLSVIKRSRSDTDAGRLATAVLDYRHSTTVLGLFLAPYTALCERADGRMRPTVYTLGTDTGRMSAVRPNAQQLPREGGIRSVVTADPGHVLISADFSGVELRGAAALSQDPTMMHMIAEEDAGRFDGFHWAVARQAFGPNATKSDRYVAKRGVFGHIYGGGVSTLAKQVGVTESEMGAIVESLKTLTPGLAAWSDGIRWAVRQGRTQFPSYSGRVIHFPRDYPHKAPNYAIQGSCRELLVDALVRWRDTRWGDCTLLPVHDELIVMVPECDAQEATTELARCMEGDLYGVKIVAEPSTPSFAWQDSV